MSSYVTPSGLVVADSHQRAMVAPDDPRSWPANDNGPGPNVPPVSVGPTSSTNAPGNFVMTPGVLGAPLVQAWSGWPTEWSTPHWGDAAGGLAGMVNRVSTVFGAIDLNARILSTMPPYRMQGSDVVGATQWMLNPQPEVYTGWIEAMKQIVVSYFNGEVYLWSTSRYADGTVRTFVMLNPSWVEIEQDGQLRRYTMGGLDITADVLHIRYTSWPGDPHGHGPLEALANNLFGAAALERYQANLAVRGGIPWGALTAPGNLSQDQATAMRDNFVAARLSAMGAPVVLSGGVTLEPFTINPKDMALLELRQFDEARIATLLGCPPTLLGLPTGESMTYKNVESVYDFHWRSSLRPVASMLMEAISNWALPSTQRVELNRDEYVRPGFAERIIGWSTLFNIVDPSTGQRAISIEEIRTAERLTGVGATNTSVAR